MISSQIDSNVNKIQPREIVPKITSPLQAHNNSCTCSKNRFRNPLLKKRLEAPGDFDAAYSVGPRVKLFGRGCCNFLAVDPT